MTFSPSAQACSRLRKVPLAAAACLVLAGCSGGQEFAYHPVDEIPQGAGLVTDEGGEFAVVKWDPRGRSKSSPETTVSAPSPDAPRAAKSTSGITEAATPE